MKREKITFANIDSYIAHADPAARAALQEIRGRIQQLIPHATETISYQMPAFKVTKPFVYFAAFKKHIGMYPPVKNNAALQKELAPYANATGNLRFELGEELPHALISHVVLALAKQHGIKFRALPK